MADPEAGLDGGDGACHGRIDVAYHNRQVGPVFQGDLLKFHHNPARLLRVGAAADAQVHVGHRELQVLEEKIGHIHVVVLARVNDPRICPWLIDKYMIKRGDLHKIGSRACDKIDQLLIVHSLGTNLYMTWRGLVERPKRLVKEKDQATAYGDYCKPLRL